MFKNCINNLCNLLKHITYQQIINSMSEEQNLNQNIETICENEEFEIQDDSKINENVASDTVNNINLNLDNGENEELLKYTKIDHLAEDPPIPGQRYFCISFISPEGLMNCKTRGFKLRGVYGSLTEAQQACKQFQKIDKYFDVFVAEVGKWCPWDPSNDQVKKSIYQGKGQNEVMKSVQEKELKQLNEIVGRHKDKINNAKVSHKERVANAMKQTVESYKDQKEADANATIAENEKNDKIEKARKYGSKANKSSESGKQNVRDRLRRMVEQKEELKKTSPNYYPTESLNQQKDKLMAESQRIGQQESNLDEVNKKSEEIDNKIQKIKDYLNSKKSH